MHTNLPDLKPKIAFPNVAHYDAMVNPEGIDHLLLRVLEHDDYGAFEKLFIFNYDTLRNFCKKLVQINEVAEELVSEVFFKIWVNRKRIVISSSPRSYLYTAVRNISFDHLRKEKRSHWVNLEEAAAIPCNNSDPQGDSEFEELQVKVERAVERLPKQCRKVFRLSRDNGMKYNEIAEELKVSVKTIETQMGRALKALRVTLKSEYNPAGFVGGNKNLTVYIDYGPPK